MTKPLFIQAVLDRTDERGKKTQHRVLIPFTQIVGIIEGENQSEILLSPMFVQSIGVNSKVFLSGISLKMIHEFIEPLLPVGKK